MRGRVISFSFLLLFTLFSPALAQSCLWTPRYSAQSRATVYDVAVDAQNVVWIATGYGVQALEPRTGGGLNPAGEIGIPGSTRVVAPAGNGIAYAGSGTRVYVVRRNGKKLELVSSVDTGGTVNDIAIHPQKFLFVATSKGIVHYDTFDPLVPVRTSQVVSTTSANVTSLALAGSTLYAADGDSTVEVIAIANPALPQKTGTLTSHARSVAVHVAGASIFVGDDFGTNTDLFFGGARLARFGYGSTAFAPLSGNSYFTGNDRTLRAIDITSTSRIAELFEQALAPTGGTNNRIFEMTRSGNTLYVAAGDIGLLTYDVSGLLAKHPVVSYTDGARTSALLVDQKAYFTDADRVYELSVDGNGVAMSVARSWSAPAGTLVHDFASSRLVTSAGSAVNLYDLSTSTPSIASTTTFASAVKSAVMSGNTLVAVLSNGTVARATPGSTPEAVNLGEGTAASIARFGSGIAIASVTEAGNTIVRFFASGDVTSTPRTFTIEGASIGGVALGATHAAVFTFKGLTTFDLTFGTARTFAGSNRTIPKQLFLSLDNLLVLANSSLAVWDITTATQVRELALPADGVSLSASGNLAVVAGGGSTAIDVTGTLPAGTTTIKNHYYTKVVADTNDLYLFGDNVVDVFWTGQGAAPSYVTTVSTPGVADVTALPQSAFATLDAFGAVTTYSSSGAQLAQTTLNEGADAQPLSIFAAGNALWVSVIKGCQSGTCEKKTLVLDPKTLGVTASISGGVVDVVTSGTKAYVLLSLPDEARVYDITDPLQPSVRTAMSAPAFSNSIAFSGGQVYVLADKVYAYNELFTPTGEFLSSVSAPGAHMKIQNSCAIITGRGSNPEFWGLPAWGSLLILTEVPSPIRSVALQPGRAYFLTDHSLEVWMNANPAPPTKRRSAR